MFDDDFSSGTLDVKWDVTNGSSGTVGLLNTSKSTATYDLTTVSGFLACQVENNRVEMRQDYTLQDGYSIIMKLHPANNASSNAANEIRVGFLLNTSDTSALTATSSGVMYIEFDTTTDGWRIFGELLATNSTTTDSTAIGDAGDESTMNGGTVYLRIARSGSSYYWFASFDGVGWVPMKTAQTPPATFTNVWIRARSEVDTSTKVLPVQLIEWIKEIPNTQFVVV